MALTAEDIKRLMPSLEQYLAMKAAEGLDMETGEEPETPSMESAPSTEGKEGGGMGVLLALKPKGGPPGASGGKVEGCPDCADGTPHEHVK